MSQAIYSFDNGYGASVVDTGYGSPMFELAVTHGKRNGDGARLCYATHITDNVIGWLTQERVDSLLVITKALPTNELCSHKRWEKEE